MNQTKNQAKRKSRSPWAMLGTIALSQLLLALKNKAKMKSKLTTEVLKF